MTLDVDTLLVMNGLITKGNIHDSCVSRGLIDLVRDFSCIVGYSACDASYL